MKYGPMIFRLAKQQPLKCFSDIGMHIILSRATSVGCQKYKEKKNVQCLQDEHLVGGLKPSQKYESIGMVFPKRGWKKNESTARTQSISLLQSFAACSLGSQKRPQRPCAKLGSFLTSRRESGRPQRGFTVTKQLSNVAH